MDTSFIKGQYFNVFLNSNSENRKVPTCNLSQMDSPNLCNIPGIFWKATLHNNFPSRIGYLFYSCLRLDYQKRGFPTKLANCKSPGT